VAFMIFLLVFLVKRRSLICCTTSCWDSLRNRKPGGAHGYFGRFTVDRLKFYDVHMGGALGSWPKALIVHIDTLHSSTPDLDVH